MTTLQAVAWGIVGLAVVNTYFMWDSIRRFFRGQKHPILRALLVTKGVIWFAGLFIGLIAARAAVGLPGLPAGGMALAWIIVSIMLIPSFIWAVMRRYQA